MEAENLRLFTLVEDATHVTVWRIQRLVVMRYPGGRTTKRRAALLAALNVLERDLAIAGWRLQIANTCRTEWSR